MGGSCAHTTEEKYVAILVFMFHLCMIGWGVLNQHTISKIFKNIFNEGKGSKDIVNFNNKKMVLIIHGYTM